MLDSIYSVQEIVCQCVFRDISTLTITLKINSPKDNKQINTIINIVLDFLYKCSMFLLI